MGTTDLRSLVAVKCPNIWRNEIGTIVNSKMWLVTVLRWDIATIIRRIRETLAALPSVYKNIRARAAPQMVLKLPHGHEDSEYVLSFEIGQREGGYFSSLLDWWS